MNSALFRPLSATRTVNLRGRVVGIRDPKNSLPRLFVGADGVVGAPLLAPCDGGLYAGAASSNLGATGFRIPVLLRAANGDVLLFAEGRSDNQYDYKSNMIIVARSRDKGKTFGSPAKITAETTDITNFYIGNPCVAVHPTSGRIHLVFRRWRQTAYTAANNSIWACYSDDHGATWSAPADITASVRVAGGGTTPAGHTWPATDWFETNTGPCTGIYHAATGRLVFTGYHRLVDGGSAYSHLFGTDDDGATWELWGGPDQSDAGNIGAIEGAIALRPDGSTIVVNCRMKSGTQRAQFTSSDGGTTATDLSLVSGPGNQTNQGCQGALLTVGSKMLLSVADSTTSHRILPTVYQSDDGGVTWENPRRLGFRWAAYSALLSLDRGEYLAVFEGFPTGTADAYSAWCQAFYPHYFNHSFLTEEQTPACDWSLDDVPLNQVVVAGESTLANGGTNLRDRGQNTRINYNERIQPRDTSNQPVVGADGVSSRNAMTLSSDSDFISLAPPDCYLMQPGSGQAFTFQAVLKCTGTSAAIARSASSGARWMLDLNANGRPVATLSDGTNTVTTADSGTVINDDAWHVVALRRTGSRVQIIVDGTQTQDIADTTGSLRQDTEVRFGCDHSGTSQLAGTIDRIRWTLGSVADSQLLSASDKGAPPAISYPAGSPAELTGLKLWVPTSLPELWHHGRYLEAPRTIGTRSNIGAQSVRDAATGALWRIHTSTALTITRLSGRITNHAQLGWCWNVQDEPVAAGTNGQALARTVNTDLDFIPTGGVNGAFTIAFGCVSTAGTGTSQIPIDNNNGTSTNVGFSINLSNADPGAVQFFISRGGSPIYTQTSGAELSRNLPYMVLICSDGNGAGVDWYIRRIDTNTTPGSATVRGTAPTLSAVSSSMGLGIGGRVGAWSGPGSTSPDRNWCGQLADPIVCNAKLSAAEIQAYFDWLKNGPSRA